MINILRKSHVHKQACVGRLEEKQSNSQNMKWLYLMVIFNASTRDWEWNLHNESHDSRFIVAWFLTVGQLILSVVAFCLDLQSGQLLLSFRSQCRCGGVKELIDFTELPDEFLTHGIMVRRVSYSKCPLDIASPTASYTTVNNLKFNSSVVVHNK